MRGSGACLSARDRGSLENAHESCGGVEGFLAYLGTPVRHRPTHEGNPHRAVRSGWMWDG
jgi:hypothetical protein